MGKKKSVPVWNRKEDMIVWKEKHFPLLTFYAIHARTRDLIDLLENSEGVRGKMQFVLVCMQEFQKLEKALREVSDEAFWEAFQANLDLDRFFSEEREEQKQLVLSHLRKIRRLVYLDEIFKTQTSEKEA